MNEVTSIGIEEDQRFPPSGEGVKNLDRHAGDLADKALSAADAWDEANGVHRIGISQIQNLARRLMESDLTESLEVLNALASGNLAAFDV